MASRREELQVNITASDNASKAVDAVAEKLERLESAQAEIDVTATDEASDVIEDVSENVEGLDGETAEATLEAEDGITDVVADASGELFSLDGEVVSATIDADDQASGEAEEALTALEAVEDTFTATIETEGADSAAESTGSIVGDLGEIGGATAGSGLAALSAAGFLAIAQKAADAALEVDGIAQATGGSLEGVSRLMEAWELAGGSPDTLERNIIRANQKLRESPELAGQLGVEIGQNTSAFDVFIAAVRALNSGQLTANERLTLATEIFGSRGVLMLNDLQTRVGDIDQAMADVGENEIITQEDIDAALEFQASWDDVQDAIGAIQRKILPAIATLTKNVASLLDTWPVDRLISGFDILGTKVSLLESLFGPMGNDAGSVVATIEDVATEIENLLGLTREDITFPLIEAWRALKEDLADNGEVDTATDSLTLLAEAAGMSEDDVLAAAQGLDEEARAAIDAAVAAQEHAEALADESAAIEEQISALERLRDANLERIEQAREATDAVYAARDADRDFREQVAETTGTLNDSEASADDQAAALDDLALAAADAADAQVDLLGDTASATAKIDTQNRSLLASAASLDGPMRDAVVGYLAQLNELPPEVVSQIKAALDRGDIAEAERLLTNASRTRTAAIRAASDAHQIWLIENRLNHLARARTVHIGVDGPGAHGGQNAVATGTSYAARGLTLVGEHGPELMEMSGGERVANAGQTAEMMRNGRGGGGMVVNHITNNWPRGVPSRDLAAAMRRQQRIQGKPF